jgi:hypothetical protein
MREASAALWREFLSGYGCIHLYTVDPGAHAMATELVPLIRDMGRLGVWFAEGWSAEREDDCRPAAELPRGLNAGDAIILCSQTNYARTQAVLKQAADAGATTVFLFDHWKNFKEHFGEGPLADVIVVPDGAARAPLMGALGEVVVNRIRVLPHLAVEAASDSVAASGVTPQRGVIAMLLDPTEPADGLGYDWRSILAAASELVRHRSNARLLVKPHPRQSADTVACEVAAWQERGVTIEMYSGDTAQLIAMAEEVWGMTTVALNVALSVGKPIRSFQIGRNAAGVLASNPHIEPYVVV